MAWNLFSRSSDIWMEPVLSRSTMMNVQVELVGRQNGGKTALFRALIKGPLNEYLPSGLHMDASDPLAVAEMLKTWDRTIRGLQKRGLTTTLETTPIDYILFEGDEPRVVFKSREVIGQILTNTTTESPPDEKEAYRCYVDRLVQADVLWVLVPTPPANARGVDRDRYDRDLKTTGAYLRQALKERSAERPCAVVLILNKIDGRFASVEEAREQLSDERLEQALSPLIQLVSMSAKVSCAAIVPTTAFGFGNAQLQPSSGDGASADDGRTVDEHEPIWILKDGEVMEPYNLTALVVWTLLHGLLVQKVPVPTDGSEPPMARICRTLREDFQQLNGWVLNVKSSS